MTIDFIPHTKRRAMTKARAARIFLRENGCCYVCLRKLRVGVDKYQIEHPAALSLGGSDDDADLRVICHACHKPKTAEDAKAKARRDRIVTAGWDNGSKPKLQSAGFKPAARQHRATSKLKAKFEGDIRGDWSPAVLKKEQS